MTTTVTADGEAFSEVCIVHRCLPVTRYGSRWRMRMMDKFLWRTLPSSIALDDDGVMEVRMKEMGLESVGFRGRQPRHD